MYINPEKDIKYWINYYKIKFTSSYYSNITNVTVDDYAPKLYNWIIYIIKCRFFIKK